MSRRKKEKYLITWESLNISGQEIHARHEFIVCA
jgi:hypothetical protein